MLADFFMDGQKPTQRRKFVTQFVTGKLLKMSATSKEADRIRTKKHNYGKKQLINFWHELCSIGLQFRSLEHLKRKGVNNNDKLA